MTSQQAATYVGSDLAKFALSRAIIWRDQWRTAQTAGARALCRATMRTMSHVWRRETLRRQHENAP